MSDADTIPDFVKGLVNGLPFCSQPANLDAFPCNSTAIVAVSVGIGAASCALLFVIWLFHKVRVVVLRFIYPAYTPLAPGHLADDTVDCVVVAVVVVCVEAIESGVNH